MAELRLVSARFSIQVTAPPADLEWLCEFFAPALEAEESVAANPSATSSSSILTVELRRDDALFEKMRESIQPGGETVPAYMGDAGYFEVVRCNHLEPLYYDPAFDVLSLLNPDERQVTLIARSSEAEARVSLMRVVRELWSSALTIQGARIVHASCCDVANQGVLIAGPKGAGKSSLATYLLQQTKSRAVGNDRVALMHCPETRKVQALGIATIIAFKAGALKLFPQLRREVWRRSYVFRRSLSEVRAQTAGPEDWQDDAPFGLSPAQYLCQLEAEAVAATELGLILFPVIRPDIKGAVLRQCLPEDTENRMAAVCFRQAAPIFREFDPPQTRSVEPLQLQTLARIPAFECELGPDAYRDEDLARQIRQLITVNS